MKPLAFAVRRGELASQAYCLMSTHFRLLASSPGGRLSYTMSRIQSAHARYPNQRSRVDGPLCRGRFGRRPVLSFRYGLTLLRYMAHDMAHDIAQDVAQDATQVGLCEHPYSSAARFAGVGTLLGSIARGFGVGWACSKARRPRTAASPRSCVPPWRVG
jgi:hypothetical protein